MLKDEDSVVTRIAQFNVDYEAVKNEFMMMLSDLNTESDNRISPPKAEYSESSPQDADDELFSKKTRQSKSF